MIDSGRPSPNDNLIRICVKENNWCGFIVDERVWIVTKGSLM